MNLTLKERLKFQKQAGIITLKEYNELINESFLYEDISDEEIEKSVAAALKISPDQVAIHEPSEDEKEINEIALTTAITVAGLIPPALNLIGSVINKTKQHYGLNDREKELLANLNAKILKKEELIKKLDKEDSGQEIKERELLANLIKQKDEQFGTKLGNLAKHAGHGLHDLYTIPIKKFLDMVAWTAEKFGKKTRLQDEKFKEKIANIIYAVIMAGIAGFGVFEHIGHLAGVSETALTIADGIKAGKSVADIVKGAALLI